MLNENYYIAIVAFLVGRLAPTSRMFRSAKHWLYVRRLKKQGACVSAAESFCPRVDPVGGFRYVRQVELEDTNDD